MRKYQLKGVITDRYDCDYTGSSINLISKFNRLFTKTFLTKEVNEKINQLLDGKPYPKFHLVFKLHSNRIELNIEYDSNLTSTSPYCNNVITYIIKGVISDYIEKDLGYPIHNVNAFVQKLLLEHPEFNKYFSIFEDSCPFCNNSGKHIYTQSDDDAHYFINLFGNGYLRIGIEDSMGLNFAKYPSIQSLKIDYCPICGRKL